MGGATGPTYAEYQIAVKNPVDECKSDDGVTSYMWTHDCKHKTFGTDNCTGPVNDETSHMMDDRGCEADGDKWRMKGCTTQAPSDEEDDKDDDDDDEDKPCLAGLTDPGELETCAATCDTTGENFSF